MGDLGCCPDLRKSVAKHLRQFQWLQDAQRCQAARGDEVGGNQRRAGTTQKGFRKRARPRYSRVEYAEFAIWRITNEIMRVIVSRRVLQEDAGDAIR